MQISRAILHRLGPELVAARVAHSGSLRGLGLRLLPAGMATGHDSIAAPRRSPPGSGGAPRGSAPRS